jgi:hypothetical protein
VELALRMKNSKEITMNDEAKTEQGLSVPSAEVGKSIVEAAKELRRKRFSDKVVAIADSELEAIAIAEKKIAYYQNCLEFSKKRLAAIEAGEFTVTQNEFTFNNPELTKTPMIPLTDSEVLLGFGGASGTGKQSGMTIRSLDMWR